MSVAIIDYGSGNLHSAAKAFERAAREGGHADAIAVTNDPEAVRAADRVVLPGVGAFADCINALRKQELLQAARDFIQTGKPFLGICLGLQLLFETVRRQGRPFLGICVGMQLLAERGREYEVTEGLGWIAGEVCRIEPRNPGLKIPHMGWNTLDERQLHPLFDGIPLGPGGLHAYFVHSYHLAVADRADLVADADYGGPVTAFVARENYAGTQFHPEKSQKLGLALIANFLNWKP